MIVRWDVYKNDECWVNEDIKVEEIHKWIDAEYGSVRTLRADVSDVHNIHLRGKNSPYIWTPNQTDFVDESSELYVISWESKVKVV